MQYPMYVACPQCSAAVIVAEPVKRCRCRKCSAFFLLSSVIEPEPNAQAPGSRPVAAAKQVSAKLAKSVERSDKPTPRTEKTKEQKSWFVILVGVCGLLLIGFLVFYFIRSNIGPAPVVIAQDATTNDVATGESTPPPVVIVPDTPQFEGSAFGQLDSLLFGASGFAGSWLTGAGAAADASYTSSSNAGYRSLAESGMRASVSETLIAREYSVEHSLNFSLVDRKPAGPLSAAPSGFGKSSVRVLASIKDSLPDAKRKIEQSGLVFVNVTPTAELETDVVVTCKPPRGTSVKDGTKVEIGAGGPVPDVTKIAIAEAVKRINSDQFTPDYDTAIADKHLVTHQLPRAGDLQVRGGKVQFACGTTMPDVETRPVSEAADTLKKDDIVFVWGWRNDYDPREYPSDVVCHQSIGRGELVFRGTKNLDGKQLALVPGVQVPNLIGLNLDDANRELTRQRIPARDPRIRRINLRRVAQAARQQPEKGLQDRDQLAISGATGDSSSWRVMAQFYRKQPPAPTVQQQQQWFHLRFESDPAIIVDQRPLERQTMCRGDWMVVDVEQKVYDVGYYQAVQQQVPNGGGFSGGGSTAGGGGHLPGGKTIQGGGGAGQLPSGGIIQGGGGGGSF